MEKKIDMNDEAKDKYELMSDGIVAEVEDKPFTIFTYGPESTYYRDDIQQKGGLLTEGKIQTRNAEQTHLYG